MVINAGLFMTGEGFYDCIRMTTVSIFFPEFAVAIDGFKKNRGSYGSVCPKRVANMIMS